MKSSKAVFWLSWLIAVLVLVAAIGVFYHTSGAPIHFVTVRGEHATYQGSGLYYYDPASVVREKEKAHSTREMKPA